MRYLSSIIAAALVTCATLAAASDGSVGRVKTVKGSASIVRGQSSLPAVFNEKVFQGDVLRTGPDGSLGIILKDDTSLSLGPDSEVVIDQFLFSPADGKLSLVARMVRGTAVYLSGIIARLSPQSVRFETPNASIGIRGTRFLVKVDEG
jgi:hypothetical protein